MSDIVTQSETSKTDDSARSTQNVAVLGCTGSIGTATVNVLQNLNRVDPLRTWRLWAASGHRNIEALVEIVRQSMQGNWGPEKVVFSDSAAVTDASVVKRIKTCGTKPTIQVGAEALVEAAKHPEVDIVVAAIVGRAGLESTIAAVEAGKRVALANKETMVVAGDLVRKTLAKCEAKMRQTSQGSDESAPTSQPSLLPVDSEHSAIFQCLSTSRSDLKRLILTASGGPFRSATFEQMRQATPKDALAHPTWQMGPKITIDSATMMNKALEIIEARWLFDVPADQIEVVVHPQSIIHSMIEFNDGSVLSQMSPPDMRMPIQYALTYPRRLPCPAATLDRSTTTELTLQPADLERFPALKLGFEVARSGGTSGAVVNAANEVAVDLFLREQIGFTEIVPLCQKVLQYHTFEDGPSLERLLDLDRWARAEALQCANKLQ